MSQKSKPTLTELKEIYRQWTQGCDIQTHIPKSFDGLCQATLVRGPHKHQICQKKAKSGKMTCGRHASREMSTKIEYFQKNGNELERIVGALNYHSNNGVVIAYYQINPVAKYKWETIWPTNTITATFELKDKDFFDIIIAILDEVLVEFEHSISQVSYFFLTSIFMDYFKYKGGLSSFLALENVNMDGFDFRFIHINAILNKIKDGVKIFHTKTALKAIKKVPIDKIEIPDGAIFSESQQADFYHRYGYQDIMCQVRQVATNVYHLDDGYDKLASAKKREQKSVNVMVIEIID